MLPAEVQVLVAGSYSSALDREELVLAPPTTRTLPLGRSVAVWLTRAADMLATAVQALVAGSYSSALGRVVPLVPPVPPTTRTLPLGRSVAVCSYRAAVMAGVDAHGAAALTAPEGLSALKDTSDFRVLRASSAEARLAAAGPSI